MAVPMTVKMPEPMTAPMPSAVSDQGPSVFLRHWPGSSDSRISLSMDLRASSWLARVVSPLYLNLFHDVGNLFKNIREYELMIKGRNALSHQLSALSGLSPGRSRSQGGC